MIFSLLTKVALSGMLMRSDTVSCCGKEPADMKRPWKPINAGFFVLAALIAGIVLPQKVRSQDLTDAINSSPALIDVNFGADQSPGLGGIKVGLAATGQSTNDFWNFYSRDDGKGNWLVNGALPNLKYVNGSVSAAGLLVSNAPGCWGNGSPDAMYNTYVYPFNGGNITVAVTNLPAGQYDFYFYSHDGSFQLEVGATDYGTRTTYDWPLATPLVWHEGTQYALFRGVTVGAGQTATLTVRPNQEPTAIISGMQISSTTVVTGTPPSIVTQPQSQAARIGWTATFTVAATGTAPLAYQWRLGGTNLAGATSSVLVLTNVQTASAGTYSVLVSNTVGSVLSSNAVLTVVQSTPSYLINIDYGSGTGPSPEVGPAAVGQGAADFWNWYTRDDGSGGWRTVGTLTNMLSANGVASGVGMTISNAPGCWAITTPDPMYSSYVYPLSGGNITVVVTNLPVGQYDFYIYNHDSSYQLSVDGTDYGIRTSYDWPVSLPLVWQEGRQYGLFRSVAIGTGQAAKITVLPGRGGLPLISGMQISSATVVTGTPPSIVAQPQSQTVGIGSAVTFTVTATGTAPLGYRWRFGTTSLGGANGSTLLLTNVQLANAGSYSVVVTNGFGSATSSSAGLVVTGTPPSILTQPQGQNVGIGGSASFSVTANGSAPLGYQWCLNDADVAGATGTSLALANIQPTNGGYYSVRVTNAFGSIASAHAALAIVQTITKPLINIDFGSGPTNGSSPEVGPAAVGQGPSDFWNWYTRDDGSGGWRTVGVLSNLKYANGASSGASMTVSNGPGCWASSASDRMYYSYIYPLNGGNLTVTLTELPAGQYDFYAYNQDGNYQLDVGATDYGTRTTLDAPIFNPTVWQEGRQYAVFRTVVVGAGQAVTLTVRPWKEPYALISGMQIVLVDQAPVALCSDVTVSAGTNCMANASIDNGSFDPDGDPITVSQSPPGPYPLGTNIVTLTVTDSHGLSSSCSARVIVVDTTPPTIVCPDPLTIEFQDDTGALASYIVTASDTCSAASLAVTPASGSLFPIGVTSVQALAVDAWGNSNQCIFTVTVLGAQGVKSDVLAELTALRGSGNLSQRFAQQFDDAIQHLAASLSSAYWVDQTHLVPKCGNTAMNEEKRAANTLADIMNAKGCPVDPAMLQGLINRIVMCDRLLAVICIQDAAQAGLNPKKVAQDLDMVAKGDEEAGKGHYDNAIEDYRNAWRHALQLHFQVSVNPDGSTRIQFVGNGSTSYQIEMSTDLVNWAPAGTCTADDQGDVEFTDTSAGNQPLRFYRVVGQ
jgi:hypothetical protein